MTHTLPYNDRAIRAAAALDNKRTRYTITGKTGLMLVVLPGDPEPSRTYYVRYQVGKGASRRQGYDPIGSAKHFSCAQAWDRASEIIRAAKSGIDQKAEAEAANAAKTVEAEHAARTLKTCMTHWLDNPGRKRVLAPRTREEYERIFKLHVWPHFEGMPLSSITADDIAEALETVRKATSDADKGQRGLQANKARTLLMSLFRHARKQRSGDQRWVTENPVELVDDPVPDRNPHGKQHRPPDDAELRVIWNNADQRMGAQSARALKAAILLGRRVSELVNAQPRELQFDETEPTLFIPANREGNKGKVDDIVPLPPESVILLRSAVAVGGKKAEYVFQTAADRATATSRHTPSSEFRAMCDELEIASNVRLHDARGLVNDHMSQMGVPQDIRSRILHHTGDIKGALVNSTYSTYEFQAEKRRALELWERRVMAIIAGRKVPAERW